MHIVPVVHIGVEAIAIRDRLRQGQSANDNIHTERVLGGAHLFRHIIGINPPATVSQHGIDNQLVRSQRAFAKGVKLTREGGNTIGIEWKGNDALFATGRFAGNRSTCPTVFRSDSWRIAGSRR